MDPILKERFISSYHEKERYRIVNDYLEKFFHDPSPSAVHVEEMDHRCILRFGRYGLEGRIKSARELALFLCGFLDLRVNALSNL